MCGALLSPVLAARHALVVGNDSYQHIPPLKNARADARAMAQALENAGFRVTTVLDQPRHGLNSALRTFKSQLSGGDEAVFFFAGHGVQLGGSNYLLPTDIRDDHPDQIKDDALHLQRVLDDLAEQKVRFSLAIVDACRDNPFKGAGRNVAGRGLVPTTAANGQMIIYSAGANQVALDRLGKTDSDPNSVFTRVFVQEIQKPGVAAYEALRNVREEVVRLAKGVGHDQVPAIYDQSVGKFVFTKGTQLAVAQPSAAPASLAAPAALPDAEARLWAVVKDSVQREDLAAYLGQYPQGRYAAQAKAALAKLDAAAQRAAEAAAERDRAAWNRAAKLATADAYQGYLADWPQGSYRALAETRLRGLESKPSVAAKAQGELIDGRWQIGHEGQTVTDLTTGLMWQRCAVGMNWTGDGCSGVASEMNWDASMQQRSTLAGISDWRLPTKDELKTLVWCSNGAKMPPNDYGSCGTGASSPTINQRAFPGTPDFWFWSSSPDVRIAYYAWFVFFSHGGVLSDKRVSNFHVRLVRTAQ